MGDHERRVRRENQEKYLEYFFGRSSIRPQIERNDLDDDSYEQIETMVETEADSPTFDKIGLEDFLIRLFGEKYGAGVISSDNLRSADSLPPVTRVEVPIVEEVAQVDDEPPRPVVPLDDLLVTIFGPRYGTGQFSPVKLREISEFTLIQSQSHEPANDPPKADSPLPSSIDSNEFLAKLFGEKYGSGDLETANLRSIEDLQINAPDNTECSQLQDTRIDSPLPCAKDSSTLLEAIFGSLYGTGSLDRSQLRSADEIPKVSFNETKPREATPEPFVQKNIDPEGALEKLFGPRYGSGTQDYAFQDQIELAKFSTDLKLNVIKLLVTIRYPVNRNARHKLTTQCLRLAKNRISKFRSTRQSASGRHRSR